MTLRLAEACDAGVPAAAGLRRDTSESSPRSGLALWKDMAVRLYVIHG